MAPLFEGPVRPFAIRSCALLRTPDAFETASARSSDLSSVKALLSAIPEQAADSIEHLAWSERLADALVPPLLAQGQFDRAAVATALGLDLDSAMLDLISAFHAELSTYREVLASDWWRMEITHHKPFSGLHSGTCLHAIIRSEQQWDEWESTLTTKALSLDPSEFPNLEGNFLDRVKHACACNIALQHPVDPTGRGCRLFRA